jgi:hypothetical protein
MWCMFKVGRKNGLWGFQMGSLDRFRDDLLTLSSSSYKPSSGKIIPLRVMSETTLAVRSKAA